MKVDQESDRHGVLGREFHSWAILRPMVWPVVPRRTDMTTMFAGVDHGALGCGGVETQNVGFSSPAGLVRINQRATDQHHWQLRSLEHAC